MTPLTRPQTILGLTPYRPIPPRRSRAPKETEMIATITVAGSITAQGFLATAHDDGRITIEDGLRRLTG